MHRKAKMSFSTEPRSSGPRSFCSPSRAGRAVLSILVAALLSACQTLYPNVALPPGASNQLISVQLPDTADDPVILMAFSGGGTRAAALSYAILHEFNQYFYQSHGRTVTLLDQVRLISSVSGGSVTAGYYGLAKDNDLEQFPARFLERDNMKTLEWTVANPITWFRLTSGSYTRIDVMKDLLDRELFHGQTFQTTPEASRPVVILNATDMASGEVFAFTPQRFNDLCSDLVQLPVSVGVVASAAFPVALSPVDLKNYSGEACRGAIPTDHWIAADLKETSVTRYLDVEEYKRARYANALRRGPNAFRKIDYIHLLDGGVADNQGVHSLLDAIVSPHGPVHLLDAINRGEVKNIVVVSVNARSDPASNLDQQARTPGVIDMIKTVTSVPIDAETASVNANLQLLIDTLSQAGRFAKEGNPKFAGLRVYGIQIDFDQLLDSQTALRNQVKGIGTSWTVSADDLKAIYEAGGLLLRQHPCFQRLVLDLRIQGRLPETIHADACGP